MALACACECVHTLCDVVEVSNVDLSAAAAAARCERWEALLQGWGGGACARAYIIVDSQANREDHDEALVHTEPRAHEHDNTNHTEDHNTDADRRLRREGGYPQFLIYNNRENLKEQIAPNLAFEGLNFLNNDFLNKVLGVANLEKSFRA